MTLTGNADLHWLFPQGWWSLRWLFLFAAALSLNGCGGKSSAPAPAVASCNEAFFGGEGLGSSSKAPEELVVETLQTMGELPLCSYAKRAGSLSRQVRVT
jgi:hypothetical protein